MSNHIIELKTLENKTFCLKFILNGTDSLVWVTTEFQTKPLWHKLLCWSLFYYPRFWGPEAVPDLFNSCIVFKPKNRQTPFHEFPVHFCSKFWWNFFRKFFIGSKEPPWNFRRLPCYHQHHIRWRGVLFKNPLREAWHQHPSSTSMWPIYYLNTKELKIHSFLCVGICMSLQFGRLSSSVHFGPVRKIECGSE